MQIVSTESCVFPACQLNSVTLNRISTSPPGSATNIFLLVAKNEAHISVSCLICCEPDASVIRISMPQESEIN